MCVYVHVVGGNESLWKGMLDRYSRSRDSEGSSMEHGGD